ncbi:FkbM family methyltransferase [Hyphomonadaceae bacterium ML37]|nr:FkbM family methyltransferase [Hyphomonadaceae bacterium ML37]
MNELLSALKVSCFTNLLEAYCEARIEITAVIDGGAGWGETAHRMLQACPQIRTCYAFEPFPGNYRFFESADARIVLHRQALANRNGVVKFEVPSVVQEGSAWGARGLVGYSSGGSLKVMGRPGALTIDVECVRADDVVAPGETIGFIKLDLQGGEADALDGMSALLGEVEFLWVEYLGDPALCDKLSELGFMLFDTKYVFRGEPSPDALEAFDVAYTTTASTGDFRWHGYKKQRWSNFKEEFIFCKKRFNLIQTDIVAVNKRKLKNFTKALSFLEPGVPTYNPPSAVMK